MITKIDGKSTENMRLGEAVDMIQGEPGQPISLTVVHEGTKEPVELEMKRARADRRSAIAWRSNWAGMDQEVCDEIRLSAQGFLLRFAAMLYRLGFPGAMDLCDAAASEIFAIVYLRPPPAAE